MAMLRFNKVAARASLPMLCERDEPSLIVHQPNDSIAVNVADPVAFIVPVKALKGLKLSVLQRELRPVLKPKLVARKNKNKAAKARKPRAKAA